MILDELATARTGDKGDTLILAVFPRNKENFDQLVAEVTEQRMAEHFGDTVTGPVQRTVLPQLPGMVFRLPGVLGGGVTGAPTLDGHGKCLSSYALLLPLGITPPE
ncbi:AtuA-related protein [Enemella evansiae]|uniref:AtuA-like ferredoxin-fold domain-containing protein n=1 Tax=Enemella evansiae TaxID=2016499 RepID=A0A255GA21_9ACTN|nr:hypothetical protein [Enemella evansiae]OYN99829.1 hypothetical protein CGZ97_19955 [Enemella evansiae]OYO06910.1 hypothetical protein CGZ95_01150 [Enemella evansiae]OYO12768.1 hypothetical protein CGZ94_12760 [Enemella evansiae]TDO91737.1 hypothetical protein C8D81_2049 [Enemella evansiae]